MPEITVRQVGAEVIMTLIDDRRPKVEVSFDKAEAATLGSLLLNLSSAAPSAFASDLAEEKTLTRECLKPRQ